jgi:hypothetical protein
MKTIAIEWNEFWRSHRILLDGWKESCAHEADGIYVPLAKVQRLWRALEYYADTENYTACQRVDRGDGTHDYDVPVLCDGGNTARKALEGE